MVMILYIEFVTIFKCYVFVKEFARLPRASLPLRLPSQWQSIGSWLDNFC